MSDAWYNPDTTGQGYFISVLPQSGIVFLSWFTYDTNEADEVGEAHLGEANHRWVTAQGAIDGNRSEMTVYFTSGGVFDTPTPVENRADGTITLSFENCSVGLVEYDIPSIDRQGSIPIQRVVGDNIEACQINNPEAAQANGSKAGRIEAVVHQPKIRSNSEGLINTSMSDAWYNPDTTGQGYFISVLPQSGIVFLSWFTYDTNEADEVGEAHLGEANHRWVTAQGPIDGDVSEMTVYITSGGVFDTPTEVANRADGSMTLSFDSCNSGSVTYDIPSIDRQGVVPIQRVVADNVDLCEMRSQVENVWEYWKHEDVKTLDDWGENADEHSDLVALYEKEETGHIALRIDYMNLTGTAVAPTFLGLDFKTGGVSNVIQGNNGLNLDIAWDLLIVADGENITAFDTTFTELPGVLSNLVIDRHVDYLSVDLDRSALEGWAGGEFSLQALTTNGGKTTLIDQSPVAGTNDVTGRGKFVLSFMNAFTSEQPSSIDRYDGYFFRGNDRESESDDRPGERRGLRYFLDAAEKYKIPVSINDHRIEQLPGLEYLGLNDRFRTMHENGLLDLPSSTSYGQFMLWWPDDVNQKAIDLTLAAKERMEVPAAEVMYPYEAQIRVRDIETLKQAGFAAIWGLDQYIYWFGGIEDWSDPDHVAAQIKAQRKIHRINGMDFLFDPQAFYLGFIMDYRWEEPDWDNWSQAWMSRGTDEGLHNWHRRTLLNMARDEDQQQFWVTGSDLEFYQWVYQAESDWNFKWLASHPWIEVTDFSDIASRGWDVIDHGTLDLGEDEFLNQHLIDNDGHYNAYFPQHYYGGPADGHSPLIPEGVEIESLYDYVPYLQDEQLIPSGRIFGDYKTPGSIVYETLETLRAAPDNELTELAWMMFLHLIGENTFHEAEVLIPWAKSKANYTGHVKKIVAGAQWAEAAKNGELSSQTVADSLDLDLDGENEYTLSNDQLFVIFENDGGRVEYAFAWHPDVGPVQLIAPFNQVAMFGPDLEFHLFGETASTTAVRGNDAVFSDQDAQNGEPILTAMDAQIGNGSLEFETSDGKVNKHFTLSGDTLSAAYSLSGIEALQTNFCFVTNMLGRYERDWKKSFDTVQADGQTVGWQTSNGGYAAVNAQDVSIVRADSFLDSPVDVEMFEREDPDSYPPGHGQLFPWGCLVTISQDAGSNFEVSVTLRADSDSMP